VHFQSLLGVHFHWGDWNWGGYWELNCCQVMNFHYLGWYPDLMVQDWDSREQDWDSKEEDWDWMVQGWDWMERGWDWMERGWDWMVQDWDWMERGWDSREEDFDQALHFRIRTPWLPYCTQIHPYIQTGHNSNLWADINRY
jgi:hypothetical protein